VDGADHAVAPSLSVGQYAIATGDDGTAIAVRGENTPRSTGGMPG
jgi:hypothetical protein